MQTYRCLLCDSCISEKDVDAHKRTHGAKSKYGIMWPQSIENASPFMVPVHSSHILASILGVRHVYIRDEGAAPSGSMKDYGVIHTLEHGIRKGFRMFFVVSSGNHAFSLGVHAQKYGVRAVVFAPASSSKLKALGTMPSVTAIGIKGAIFEEVYNLITSLPINAYNANVSNEIVISGFSQVGREILSLDPLPTHVLAGVGNGTYLAGCGLGFTQSSLSPFEYPKIVPVGMKGAFPTEVALRKLLPICFYKEFHANEASIDAAEGSIAIESYSMPQLVTAVWATQGFSLGGLTNRDLATAYELLGQDALLLTQGAIPEPTGIMGLAAALKWRKRFSQDSVLLISFTGHGVKDLDGIAKTAPHPQLFVKAALESRPDLRPKEGEGHVKVIDKHDSDSLVKEIKALMGR